MKTILAAASIAAMSLLGAGAASAMPAAPLGSVDTAGVIHVAQGCGPGWARNRFGECRPMRGPRGPVVVAPRVVAPYVVAPRVCGPGLVWRHGRCRPVF